MNSSASKYLAVTEWNTLQYHKKLTNPPWTRLHQAWLSDYRFSQLSLQQWGVLFGMHMLAARTGNRIPYDCAWIAKQFGKRTSPVSKVILNLISAGFLSEFEEHPSTKKINRLSFISDAGVALQEGEEGKEGNTEQKGNSVSPFFDESHEPNRASQGVTRSATGLNTYPSSPQFDCTNQRRRDPRDFETIKTRVLHVAQKFNTTDADTVLRFAGQSLKISPKQCQTAVKQLIEDGKL